MLKLAQLKVFYIICCGLIVFMFVFINQSGHSVQNNDDLVPEKQFTYSNPEQKSKTQKIRLDNSKPPIANDLPQLFEQELPNVPFVYWFANEKKSLRLNKTCAKYPTLYNLDYYNNYWQVFRNEKITMHLFGAYYDCRLSVPLGPVVRVIAMVSEANIDFLQTFCQLWFQNKTEPTIVPITNIKMIWNTGWGKASNELYPYLLTCNTTANSTDSSNIPQTVSLVKQPCETASNNLKVNYDNPSTYNSNRLEFGICIKGLDYPYDDISARLVEWLELMRLLGASKVHAHNFATHPNVSKVLKYYQADGLLEVLPITLASSTPQVEHFQHFLIQSLRLRKRLNELISYNDCFYRNMYMYKYIALVDIDEVIMPLGNLTSWQDLNKIMTGIATENQKKCPNGYSSICFRQANFPKNEQYWINDTIAADDYMYMLKHRKRFEMHSKAGLATKCFHNTSEVLTLHNHFPRSWLKSCRPITLNPLLAQMEHYRYLKNPNPNEEIITDDSILRYKVPLRAAAEKVLRRLGFLNRN